MFPRRTAPLTSIGEPRAAIAQAAATAALDGPTEWFVQIVHRFARNRDLLMTAIERISGVHCVKPASTPFALLNLSDFQEPPEVISRRLLEDYGIPSVPGEAFQASRHLRIPFGGATSVVEEACGRLVRAFAGHERTPHQSATR